MQRPAMARREEGAFRQYSTDEERRQTGWIGGQKCEELFLTGPCAGGHGDGRMVTVCAESFGLAE